VRDFYPEDMAVENYIFKTMRRVAESFGYEEYGASVLEPAELYEAKTGEEIVSEQTYTFTDRGGRRVTLRPEMTPTVARMIAARRRELPLPIRWYSIPNLFRYERPQRGRLREHWQLNCDIFGVTGIEAEAEIISLAAELLRAFGLKDEDFEIRLNSRKIMDYCISGVLGLQGDDGKTICRLIDKKNKISDEEFKKTAADILGEKDKLLLALLNSKNFEEFISRLPRDEEAEKTLNETKGLIKVLDGLGIYNIRFDQTIMRGFDYYTGTVFEIYDTDAKNRRSLFGGGRFDKLLSIFGAPDLPAVGFGMGDVTMRDILETRGLLPPYRPPAKVVVCIVEKSALPYGNDLTQKLRAEGVAVLIDCSGRKVGDQIKAADKRGIPFVVCVGGAEVKSGKLKVKELKTGEETEVEEGQLARLLKNRAVK